MSEIVQSLQPVVVEVMFRTTHETFRVLQGICKTGPHVFRMTGTWSIQKVVSSSHNCRPSLIGSVGGTVIGYFQIQILGFRIAESIGSEAFPQRARGKQKSCYMRFAIRIRSVQAILAG